MILYDGSHKISLMDFGIEIPISDNKRSKTLEYLEQNPIIQKKLNSFSVIKVDERLTRMDLLRAHSPRYVDRLFSEGLEQEIIRTYELIDEKGNYNRYNPQNAKLPLAALFNNQLEKAAGSLQCCNIALDKGFCFYFGGGNHHAKKDYGEGFCLVNDVVISIRRLQDEKKIETAWVIDVDAHKGDGTAALTHDDNTIKTLSIHMAKGWPLDGEQYKDGELNPSFIPSDIDIPIDSGEEHLYLERLEEGLHKLNTLGKPQIAVVVMGVDPYEKDELASTKGLNLTLEQMKKRDLLIYNFLKKQNVPQAHLMAGGYGVNSWRVYSQFLEHVLLEEIKSI